jgi:hypothetical protein
VADVDGNYIYFGTDSSRLFAVRTGGSFRWKPHPPSFRRHHPADRTPPNRTHFRHRRQGLCSALFNLFPRPPRWEPFGPRLGKCAGHQPGQQYGLCRHQRRCPFALKSSDGGFGDTRRSVGPIKRKPAWMPTAPLRLEWHVYALNRSRPLTDAQRLKWPPLGQHRQRCERD